MFQTEFMFSRFDQQDIRKGSRYMMIHIVQLGVLIDWRVGAPKQYNVFNIIKKNERKNNIFLYFILEFWILDDDIEHSAFLSLVHVHIKFIILSRVFRVFMKSFSLVESIKQL